MKLKTFSDGGSRGNPGPAGIGVVLIDESGKAIYKRGKYIGKTTNNQAEYQALILALEKAHELGATEVASYLDSELVVKQMKGEYKVKDAGLATLYLKVWSLKQKFKSISFHHVFREKNAEADELVNIALDKYQSGK